MLDRKPGAKVLDLDHVKLGVIGLGYVGLPLAIAFAKKFAVVGFDTDKKKIESLRQGIDPTGELIDVADLKLASFTTTADRSDLTKCQIIIVAVPTPVDRGNKPDLRPLLGACETLGHIVKAASDPVYICFESTVYPGCTEEDCLPVIERFSGKKHGTDFFLGYSPERINPGDRIHRFESILKVVSGCCPESSAVFEALYASVVTAGVYVAATIKVAEAAKVIENTQRDLNIALVNELAVIFARLGIDTRSVLEAAGTKWNFLKFQPGLVGGHCIGVDPFYLTYKAETVGYRPRVILAGRAVNDEMAVFVAHEGIKRATRYPPRDGIGYRSLVVGFTFKENVPDIRNTKVIDLVKALEDFNFKVDVIDSVGCKIEALEEYGLQLHNEPPRPMIDYDLVILAVAHDHSKELVLTRLAHCAAHVKSPVSVIDVKGLLADGEIRDLGESVSYWRL